MSQPNGGVIGKAIEVKLDQLLLDADNPRFQMSGKSKDQI